MPHDICNWKHGYIIDNPIRGIIHRPSKILGPYVSPGMKILDTGCGMGIFSIGMARLLKGKGSVTAIDLQPQMTRVASARARRKKLDGIISFRNCESDSLGLLEDEIFDFALSFYMVHEVPDMAAFFREVSAHLADGARYLVVEPNGHVDREEMESYLSPAAAAGLEEAARPDVRGSRSILFRRRA